MLVRPPHSWIMKVTSNFPATIRILDCKPLAETEGVQEFFELDAPEKFFDEIVSTMRKDDYIREMEVTRGKGGRVLGAVKTRRCTACRTVATSGCFLTSARTRQDGRLEWNVAGSEAMFRELVQKLEKGNVQFELVSLTKLQDVNALTARQETILQIALDRGFFDFPRLIGLRELANALDISAATLSEILRRSQKKVLLQHFSGKQSTRTYADRIAS